MSSSSGAEVYCGLADPHQPVEPPGMRFITHNIAVIPGVYLDGATRPTVDQWVVYRKRPKQRSSDPPPPPLVHPPPPLPSRPSTAAQPPPPPVVNNNVSSSSYNISQHRRNVQITPPPRPRAPVAKRSSNFEEGYMRPLQTFGEYHFSSFANNPGWVETLQEVPPRTGSASHVPPYSDQCARCTCPGYQNHRLEYLDHYNHGTRGNPFAETYPTMRDIDEATYNNGSRGFSYYRDLPVPRVAYVGNWTGTTEENVIRWVLQHRRTASPICSYREREKLRRQRQVRSGSVCYYLLMTLFFSSIFYYALELL